jgi:hypothetical protein
MKNVLQLFAILFSSIVFSQIPTLEINQLKENPVKLQEAKIETKILGNLATTTATSKKISEVTIVEPINSFPVIFPAFFH